MKYTYINIGVGFPYVWTKDVGQTAGTRTNEQFHKGKLWSKISLKTEVR